MCPRCGWADTRKSMRIGVIDAFVSLFLLIPFRCRKCQTRFFRFRNRWAKFVLLAAMVVVCALGVTGYRWVQQRRMRHRSDRALLHPVKLVRRLRSRPDVAAINADR